MGGSARKPTLYPWPECHRRSESYNKNEVFSTYGDPAQNKDLSLVVANLLRTAVTLEPLPFSVRNGEKQVGDLPLRAERGQNVAKRSKRRQAGARFSPFVRSQHAVRELHVTSRD